MKVNRFEEVLKMPIIDELYNGRCDEYETEKMNNEKGGKRYISKIVKSFDKILKIADNNEKINNELESIYKEFLNYSVFWSKEYYKLGIVDGIKLNNEINSVEINKKMKDYTTSFINDYNDDFNDFMEDFKIKVLYKDKRYDEIRKEINNLKNKYPKVLDYLENNKITEFTTEEKKVILEIIKLEDMRNAIEVKEAFALGIREKSI